MTTNKALTRVEAWQLAGRLDQAVALCMIFLSVSAWVALTYGIVSGLAGYGWDWRDLWIYGLLASYASLGRGEAYWRIRAQHGEMLEAEHGRAQQHPGDKWAWRPARSVAMSTGGHPRPGSRTGKQP